MAILLAEKNNQESAKKRQGEAQVVLWIFVLLTAFRIAYGDHSNSFGGETGSTKVVKHWLRTEFVTDS